MLHYPEYLRTTLLSQTKTTLIKKKDLMDPLADDDDIDWKTNPFDIDSIDEHGETPEQLMTDMANKVLAGYVTRICEIFIDDVLVHAATDDEYVDSLRKVLIRLRTKKVTANPAKTRLGLKEVEYVGHLTSSTCTSFTPEKRLQVLDFSLPATQKALLQFNPSAS